jgi:thaumarchaeosortase
LEATKKRRKLLLKMLPILAFTVPLLWLYFLEPISFESMWKGRTFQLFFIWLIALELILSWEGIQVKLTKLRSIRTICFLAAMVLPTAYVAWSYYGGLNTAIWSWSTNQGILWSTTMALSIEYLVFAVMLCAILTLQFGFKGLKDFSVPAFFLVLVGVIYLIDNVYPYGTFAPFQIFVPTTTALASFFLTIMGYTTSIQNIQSSTQGLMPYLTTTNPANGATATFSIAWPCAGIESFLLFTVVVLLFLKRMKISLLAKVGYFVFGVAVTYVINSLRIVNIFLVGMAYGETSSQVNEIHLYYGPLYAMTWIVCYPLIILLSQILWRKIKSRNLTAKAQQPELNPA